MIFLCDDYVCFNSETTENRNEARKRMLRFFSIATRLNMDLQMVLCNRLYGLTKDVISSKYSEAAFRNVVRRFLTKRREN